MPDADTAVVNDVNQRYAGRGNAASSARSRSWPWALGSIGMVLVILAGTFIGRHLILGAHQPPTVSAPTTPPLSVVAVTSPHIGYQLSALDTASGHLVALVSNAALDCPPPAAGDCPSSPPLTLFTILDGATGSPIAATSLAGASSAAVRSVALLVDSSSHRAYAIAPQAVVVFSTTTGAALATYPLPAGITWQRESGAVLDSTGHTLLLAGTGQALALDTTTGHILARQTLSASAIVEGPALDAANGRLYLLLRDTPTAAPILAVYDAVTLAPAGQLTLPAGMRLGPLDSASHALYLFGGDSSVQRFPLGATLPINGASALEDQPALRGSLALGWNAATHHVYTAGATSIAARDSSTGNAIAAFPLRVAWNPAALLLVDTTRGLLYLPDMRGVIVIVHDPAAAAASTRLTPGAAALLARAALARFLPDTNQDPPFIAPATFPLSDGTSSATRDALFWIYFSGRGWSSSYSGTAQTSVTPDTAHAGGYTVTFTLVWNQLFTRTHTWVCAVASDGGVQLRSDAGDGIP